MQITTYHTQLKKCWEMTGYALHDCSMTPSLQIPWFNGDELWDMLSQIRAPWRIEYFKLEGI